MVWTKGHTSDICLKDYASVPAHEAGFEHYSTFYHDERLHKSLASRTPAEVHREHSRCEDSHPSYFCCFVVFTMGSIMDAEHLLLGCAANLVTQVSRYQGAEQVSAFVMPAHMSCSGLKWPGILSPVRTILPTKLGPKLRKLCNVFYIMAIP
jgi:hypothetical protein